MVDKLIEYYERELNDLIKAKERAKERNTFSHSSYAEDIERAVTRCFGATMFVSNLYPRDFDEINAVWLAYRVRFYKENR